MSPEEFEDVSRRTTYTLLDIFETFLDNNLGISHIEEKDICVLYTRLKDFVDELFNKKRYIK